MWWLSLVAIAAGLVAKQLQPIRTILLRETKPVVEQGQVVGIVRGGRRNLKYPY